MNKIYLYSIIILFIVICYNYNFNTKNESFKEKEKMREEVNINYKLAKPFCNMLELVMTRHPPFNKFPEHLEEYPYLDEKSFKKFRQFDEITRIKYHKYRIEMAKNLMLVSLYINDEERSKLVKISKELEKEMYRVNKILEKEYEPPTLPPFIGLQKIKVNQIIKSVMEKRYSDFLFNKDESYSKAILFTKTWINNSTISIDFHKKKLDFEVYLFLNNPLVSIDMGLFFGGGSSFGYFDSDELEVKVNKALDIVDVILPEFLKRIEKVLKDEG